MIEIRSKDYADGWWHVQCSVNLPDGTRSGLHSIQLPETATDTEIEAAVLALYN